MFQEFVLREKLWQKLEFIKAECQYQDLLSRDALARPTQKSGTFKDLSPLIESEKLWEKSKYMNAERQYYELNKAIFPVETTSDITLAPILKNQKKILNGLKINQNYLENGKNIKIVEKNNEMYWELAAINKQYFWQRSDIAHAERKYNELLVTESKCPSKNVTQSKSARKRSSRSHKFVAMDCEMVGIGWKGQDNIIGRVAIVNWQGDILLDKYVKPREPVTDYRTSVSGITPHDLESGEDFCKVQKQVIDLLKKKVLIGHGLRHDLAVLHIKHPYRDIRDTAIYRPLRHYAGNGRTPSLKQLSKVLLGKHIQKGPHNPIEDARAAMNIYKHLRTSWESRKK